MRFNCLAIAMAGSIVFASGANAAMLYGTNFGFNDQFFEINTTTGAASSVGNTSSVILIGDLASDTRSSSATIWGVELSTDSNELHTHDTTGAIVNSVLITGTDRGAEIVSLAFDETTGTLYGSTSSGFGDTSGDTLYSIDVGTGVATRIGAIGFELVYALSFDTSGNLYGISDDSHDLISINIGTGVGSSIAGNLLDGIFDMAYDGDTGTMFASHALGDSLYEIDLGTGALTLIGGYSNTDAVNIAGLAFGAVGVIPLPTTLPMLLAGIGGLGILSRRRKRS